VNYPFKEAKMSNRSFMLVPVAVVAGFLATPAAAQQPAAPPTKTMSQSLGIMVFPAKGQTAEQQAQQSAQAASQAQLDQYKKAFSVCMEGKGYTAK
jgi:hypothetical protein